MAAKCSRNLTTRSRPGRWPDRCRTTAMDAIAIEKKPIQLVASDCSRTPPTGRCDRVDRADVVQAEEAALEEVVAFGFFPVDPPGEVDQQLVEDPAEEADVAAAVDGEYLQRGPRLHRRVHVAEVPFVRGGAPPGCWNHSLHSRISCYLANAGSTWASATQWKARSDRKSVGYSHLSGIDMMSNASKWRHRELRAALRAAAGGGCAGSPSSQRAPS